MHVAALGNSWALGLEQTDHCWDSQVCFVAGHASACLAWEHPTVFLQLMKWGGVIDMFFTFSQDDSDLDVRCKGVRSPARHSTSKQEMPFQWTQQ